MLGGICFFEQVPITPCSTDSAEATSLPSSNAIT